MVKKMHILLSCLALSLISACGGGSDEVVVVDGEYSVEATALTQFDINGGTCGDASGAMTLTDNILEGSILTTNGNNLQVEGTVSENGEVAGGFALGGNAVATFTGSFSGNSGSGDWEDNFECVGTWTAERI